MNLRWTAVCSYLTDWIDKGNVSKSKTWMSSLNKVNLLIYNLIWLRCVGCRSARAEDNNEHWAVPVSDRANDMHKGTLCTQWIMLKWHPLRWRNAIYFRIASLPYQNDHDSLSWHKIAHLIEWLIHFICKHRKALALMSTSQAKNTF